MCVVWTIIKLFLRRCYERVKEEKHGIDSILSSKKLKSVFICKICCFFDWIKYNKYKITIQKSIFMDIVLDTIMFVDVQCALLLIKCSLNKMSS